MLADRCASLIDFRVEDDDWFLNKFFFQVEDRLILMMIDSSPTGDFVWESC